MANAQLTWVEDMQFVRAPAPATPSSWMQR